MKGVYVYSVALDMDTMSLDTTTYNHMAHRHSRNVTLQKVWYRNFCVVKDVWTLCSFLRLICRKMENSILPIPNILDC